jgi:succinate dehydrogenase hydrophobic anchor subunit
MRETAFWTWHMLAGVLILILLSLHMIIMHLDIIIGWFLPMGGSPVSWENVFARSKSVFFVVIYTLLLGAGLYHGLYGFRTILFELSPPAGIKATINIAFWCVGLLLFCIGTYANIAVKFIG